MTPYEIRQASIERARKRGWVVLWSEFSTEAAHDAHQILNAAERAVRRGDAWSAQRELRRAKRAIDGAEKVRQDAHGDYIGTIVSEVVRRYDELKARTRGWPKASPPVPPPSVDVSRERDPPPPEREPLDQELRKMIQREEREMGWRMRRGHAREEREAARAIRELDQIRRGRRR